MKDRLINLFFNVAGYIPYVVSYVIGGLIKIVVIGFREGWLRISDEPEPTENDLKRNIL